MFLGDPVPWKEWLDSRKYESDYPYALAYYRIFWSGVFLFLLTVIFAVGVLSYCFIAGAIKTNDFGVLFWFAAGVFIGIAILCRKKPAVQNKN